jgi:RNA polymerase sigma factor (sigma-70 family)
MPDKKYYIPIDGRKVEVTREFYKAYRRMERREQYLEERDAAHGKALYSQLDTEETTGEEMIPDRDAVPIEEAVALTLMVDKLHACMDQLTAKERDLLSDVYYLGLSQRRIAEKLGISQPAVKKRHDRIIAKLRRLIKI